MSAADSRALMHQPEESYKLLFEKSPQPMWVYDQETLKFLAVNEAAVLHYGYSHEEFLAMTIKDILDEHDQTDVINMATRIVGRHFRNARVWQHIKRDGTVIDVEITSNDETWNGRRARLVLANDVTDRKRAEREILDWKNRYEAAIAASGQILFDWDLTTNQITYAGHFKEKLQFEESDLAGGLIRLLELVHPEDRSAFQREIQRVRQSHEPLFLEFRLQKKDGDYLYFETKGRFVRAVQRKTWSLIGLLTDVTSRRLLEAQFIQAQKMEAVGHLAGGVAHDFNNSLGVILGYTQILESMPLSPQELECLNEISAATRRTALLTRQLLAFGRRQTLQPRVLNLNSLLEVLESTLRRLITKEVELVVFKNPKSGNVFFDQMQMEQVLLNLVINAREAMPQGGKLTIETTRVYLDSEYCQLHAGVNPGSYMMLAVTDTGIGMDSVTLSRIFEPFFTTKELDRGTGLGLAMVYGTVRQSGGHIWVYSEPGGGSVFKLYFPEVDQKVDIVSEEHVHKDVAGKETILVAEDEESYQKLLIRILKGSGYNVLSAANGADALEVARSFEGPIHMLLTDAVLPKLNGRKLAEELLKMCPSMKVLYMSGYTSNVIVHHGMLDPGIEFLHKPFTPNALLGKIRSIIEANRGS